MKNNIRNIKPKTLLWSAIISLATVGLTALFDFSKQADIPGHEPGFYILVLVVMFLASLGCLNRAEAEKEGRVNRKSLFILNITLSALFLFFAVEHYSSLETGRDWVMAIIFTICIPIEIKSAIKNYKIWKSTSKDTPSEENDL